ncbi:condensation domain-containing protein [Staphylococcus hyicus]|uniref:condensation domain-containing protein n=2 Tax=Staphylococcus hyicus TaxID=1284 RepID=UPI000DA3E3BC|nr:condensation domain-containing protein [Staphylococcus hyicus]MCQ9291598.1 condensation domain-containing protein [Staphylococcus hyicus]MCQ9306839.1 condensation domain-containing protein [Staphylococcus hyicus]MCQ9309522.1 condensation domain-containing protein [Staphylococcus hyicus]MCQ9311673.1 condensation domain-containing protein [Staphylococcus hyicus]SQE46365.1 iron aquisition yersiniabactin synthesis enzyme (Irp2) [Staphylococcus hyicus]
MSRLEIKRELIRLYQNGINIWFENDRLHYKSKLGKLSQDDVAFLKENKIKIIELFKSNSKYEYFKDINRFPLKDIQSAYIIGEKSVFGSVSSHVYFEVTFPTLDEIKINKIWNNLISKHEALRTVIDSWDTQKIVDSDIEYEVLVKKGEKNCNETRNRLMNKYYNPSIWPLFDIEVTQTDNQSLLHLSFDFLILDWMSIWILLKEFEYEYFHGNLQTKNHKISHLRDIYLGSELKKASSKYLHDEMYWTDKIEELGDYPKLPVKMSEIKDEFIRKSFLLNKNNWNAIKELSKKFALTHNTMALTAFACVLKKWVDQEKFVINLTTMNRESEFEDIQNVIGDFTSTNLLNVEIDEHKSFIYNAEKIQNQLLKDLEHNYFTGVETIREIRKSNSNCIFPIVFTSSLGTGVMNYEYMELGKIGISQSPQVFMDCQIMELNDELYINIDTRKGIFDNEFLEIFTKDYQHFLLDVLTNSARSSTLIHWYRKERYKDNFKQIITNCDEIEKTVDTNDKNIKNRLSDKLIHEITERCKDILKVDSLSKNDNFYKYGADSLILARLSTNIITTCEQHQLEEINFDSLLRSLLAEPTLQNILQEINNKKTDSKTDEKNENNYIGKLTIFKKGGETLKIFFHAGLGTMNCLRYLIDELKKNDQDSIAGITIQDQEKYCHIKKNQLVKKISEEYAELIKKSGYKAVHLVGYCSGGLIALEVASTLILNDVDVENVTLIDTSPSPLSKIDYMVSEMAFIQNHFITIKDVLPQINNNKLNDSIRKMYSKINTNSQYDLLNFITNKYGKEDLLKKELEEFFKNNSLNERFEIYKDVINSKQNSGITASKDFLISSYKTQMASWEGAHMTPTTYIGDVTYLKAQDKDDFDILPAQDNTEFWRNCCIGNFTEITIPGNHYNCVEDNVHASYVAKLLIKNFNR